MPLPETAIRFIVPVALTEVMGVLLPEFEAETGHQVQTITMLNPEVPECDAVAQGAYDLAITNPPYVDRMISVGHAVASTARPFARAPLAFGALGETGPVAETEPDLRACLQGADRIAITQTGTSGAMFARLATRLGLSEALAGRIVGLPGGGPIRTLLQGDVTLAALPLTNLVPVDGVAVRGICPIAWDVHIDLAIVAQSEAGPAQPLLDWLTSPSRDAELLALGGQRYPA